MPRTKGSPNKEHKPPRKTIAIRCTTTEIAKLKTVHPSPSKAIHALIEKLSTDPDTEDLVLSIRPFLRDLEGGGNG